MSNDLCQMLYKGVTKPKPKRREEHCYKWLAKGEKETQDVNFF